MARSAVTALGESGEPGSESPSKEKYPLDVRRLKLNIDLFRNTSRLSAAGEPALVLHTEGEAGSTPPGEQEVCAEAPAAPTGSGSAPCGAVTAVEPSGRFGGLLDGQSSTVSVGFHHSA